MDCYGAQRQACLWNWRGGFLLCQRASQGSFTSPLPLLPQQSSQDVTLRSFPGIIPLWIRLEPTKQIGKMRKWAEVKEQLGDIDIVGFQVKNTEVTKQFVPQPTCPIQGVAQKLVLLSEVSTLSTYSQQALEASYLGSIMGVGLQSLPYLPQAPTCSQGPCLSTCYKSELRHGQQHIRKQFVSGIQNEET